MGRFAPFSAPEVSPAGASALPEDPWWPSFTRLVVVHSFTPSQLNSHQSAAIPTLGAAISLPVARSNLSLVFKALLPSVDLLRLSWRATGPLHMPPLLPRIPPLRISRPSNSLKFNANIISSMTCNHKECSYYFFFFKMTTLLR